MKQILKRNWALDQEHKEIRQRIENEKQDLSTEKHIRSTSLPRNEIKNEKKLHQEKTVEKCRIIHLHWEGKIKEIDDEKEKIPTIGKGRRLEERKSTIEKWTFITY